MLVTGSTKLKSAKLKSVMRESSQTMSKDVPNSTQGLNTVDSHAVRLDSPDAGCFMPHVSAQFPNTWVRITIVVNNQVLCFRRAETAGGAVSPTATDEAPIRKCFLQRRSAVRTEPSGPSVPGCTVCAWYAAP